MTLESLGSLIKSNREFTVPTLVQTHQWEIKRQEMKD